MADKATTSRSTPAGDNSAKIAGLLDQVRDLMVEDGADPATAAALTDFARPGTPQIVGNLADLQRMGAIVVTGTMPTPPGQDDLKTTNTGDAFVEPPANETAVTGQVTTAEMSAAAAKAEEAKAK